VPSNPFEFRPDGYADETPIAIAAYRSTRVAAADTIPPTLHEAFLPTHGWTGSAEHLGDLAGVAVTNKTARRLKRLGVAAVEVVIGRAATGSRPRTASFTIGELV
jgi:hypothetical protein